MSDLNFKDPGYGIGEELNRVLTNSPKWIPGYQDGKNVKSWRSQTFTFRVIDDASVIDSTADIEPPEYPNTIEAWKAYLNVSFGCN